MTFNPRHLLIGLLLAVGFAAGCGKGTYLQVNFVGGGLPEIRGIGIELTLTNGAGEVTHASDVIRRGQSAPNVYLPITLPTSAAFVLDSESGTLTIDASALGIQDQVLATASKTTTVMHGKTWTVVLDFGGSPSTAGADGGT